ncbi:Intracellular septation protein A [Enhydrobacter aerosaccus]|uniref:Intracellular septation protein A n=1 Tax=Enhydrobacter aerosaccus TaxID=225324 RepID=A0A1T4JN94_9HYPH|nr:septation protein IspZ [Enhydrobacter aerosaccus]SJZ31650.1 Intracellular septation protein A [Enhydrobacter aerosaccus]
MRNLFQAARVLIADLASTILFLALYLLTNNLLLSVALGMVLGVAQIGWQLLNRKPVEALQWMSVLLVIGSGGATMLTNDPRFIMLKPTVIYAVVGLVMLKRGWMNRYLPPRAAIVTDVATTFGYAWAGLMFVSAALNISLALTIDAKSWAAIMSAWGIGSKVALFLVQYAVMTAVGRRRAAAAIAS